MLYCSSCGTQLANGAAFCSSCGEKTLQEAPIEQSGGIGPMGQVPSYQKANIQKPVMKKRKGLGCLAVVLVVFAIIIAVTANSSDTDNAPKQSKVGKVAELSEQEEIVVEGILTNLDIGTIRAVKHDESLSDDKLSAYRIETNYSDNIILYLYNKDNTVETVRWTGKNLYGDGKTNNKLTDFIITDSDVVDYQIYAKEVITEILKSPSTAKFPSINNWRMGKEDGTVIIQSYVDSQNGFGAQVRSKFQITLKAGQLTSLIFDGEELIK